MASNAKLLYAAIILIAAVSYLAVFQLHSRSCVQVTPLENPLEAYWTTSQNKSNAEACPKCTNQDSSSPALEPEQLKSLLNESAAQHLFQDMPRAEAGQIPTGLIHEPLMLHAVETWDSCAAQLHIPKVALLFLSRGHMPHEPLWRAWLQKANGLLPLEPARHSLCLLPQDASGPPAWMASCRPDDRAPQGLPHSQHLFTIYMHTPPEFAGFSNDSLFYGREIADRLATQWGHHSTTDAARNLLRAALANPLNQRFVLLSESCIPLYPPQTIYQQLMHERKSRINACIRDDWYINLERYTFRMETDRLKPYHWRKHWQWFGLVREHAELVDADQEVVGVFREYCRDAYDEEVGHHRSCFSDEHYISTLLATWGRDDETDCIGFITNADWSDVHAPHPREYWPFEVSTELLLKLRLPGENCDGPRAVDEAEGFFFTYDELRGANCSSLRSGRQQLWNTRILGYQCPLFARKFLANTTEPLLRLMQNKI